MTMDHNNFFALIFFPLLLEESSYYIASRRHTVGKCTSYCREAYADNPTKMKGCIMKCVTLECEELHPNDPKEQKECIDKLYARFSRILTYKRNQKKG
ncbi:hypothetical protein PIB30_016477 [Stylosanthes scabra]|uniref:Uncharacterized protein n=1 Tax=Stylosanthes scabra TaxID=79078 RepID=A0ABU6Y5V4_9FABA|nr:hypothetical protein [Stylosanthes scabra]